MHRTTSTNRRIRLLAAGTVVAAIASLLAVTSPPPVGADEPQPQVTLLVQFDPNLTATQQSDVIAEQGGTDSSVIAPIALHEVTVDATNVDDALAGFNADASVVSASPDITRNVAASAS